MNQRRAVELTLMAVGVLALAEKAILLVGVLVMAWGY